MEVAEFPTGAAFHESGHAVMAWLQGSHVRERGISIAADGTGECHTRSRVIPGVIPLLIADERYRSWAQWAVEADIREYLAGPIAEKLHRRLRRVALPGGATDYERVRMTLREADPDRKEQITTFRIQMLYDQTRRMIKRPRRWAAIEFLASALATRGELSDDQANEMLESSLGEPGTLDFRG